MEDAADKVDKRKSKKTEPPENVQITAQREFAKQAKTRASKNPVIDSYYVIRNQKILLVKEKKSGSKYSTYIGHLSPISTASEEDKKNAKHLKEWIKDQQAKGKVRVQI